MAQVQIVDRDQNHAPIYAANIRPATSARGLNALAVVIVNPSGDVSWPIGGAGGGGGDGAIVDGANSAIKATVRQPGGGNNPLLVALANASGDVYNGNQVSVQVAADGALVDGASAAIRATVNQYARSNPLTVVLVNASGDAYNGNQSSVTVSKWNLVPTQDAVHINSGLLGVSGDVSTVPKAGQVWPVVPQGVAGVYVVGATVPLTVSGDQYVNQRGAWATAVTGDVSTTPKAGQVWPVTEQGKTGVHVASGLLGVSGDVSTVPKAGSTWPVVVQNAPSGDGVITDGADRTIKATVRNYANAKPLAVTLTNTSGDPVGEPTAPLLQTVAGRVTNAGSTSIVGAVAGRRIKVTALELQSEADCAQGHFANGASGSQLTMSWLLGFREGVVRQVNGGRDRGFLFATSPGVALSFELSGQPFRYSVTYHSEDAS